MNKTIKWVLIIVLALGLGVGISYAATNYAQNIKWEPSNPEFTVDQPTSLDYGIIELPATKTEVYTVTNTGNVEITVTAAATPTGATTSWNATTATIPVGESRAFKLTLDIWGVGSCVVTIE